MMVVSDTTAITNLITAKRKGIIREIKPILLDLIENVGFRLHPDILAEALGHVGEE